MRPSILLKALSISQGRFAAPLYFLLISGNLLLLDSVVRRGSVAEDRPRLPTSSRQISKKLSENTNHERQKVNASNNSRESVTAIECVWADGNDVVPPSFIFSGQVISKSGTNPTSQASGNIYVKGGLYK